MTREINGLIVMRVSDDGTRCAAECPHRNGVDFACTAYHQNIVLDSVTGAYVRCRACIAAEQAVASVPSCETPRMPPWKGDPDTHIAVLRTLRYEQTSPSYGWRKPVLDALDWAITSLAETPAAASVPSWQPIETAPRDGTRVWLHFVPAFEGSTWTSRMTDGTYGVQRDDGDDYVGVGWSSGGDPWPERYWRITHWMPLPEAPKVTP